MDRKTIFAAGKKRRALLCACALLLCLPLAGCGRDGGGKGPVGQEPALTGFCLTEADFAGKNVVVYGDSITVASDRSPHVAGGKNYVDALSERLGFTVLGNFAVSATVMTHSVSVTPSPSAGTDEKFSCGRYVESNRFVNESADYALIAYGTNDFALGGTIGADTDRPESWRDVTSFKGGVRYTVRTLRSHNPDIRIVFFTPMWRASYGDPPVSARTGIRLYEFGDALYDLAKELSYRVVDMYPLFDAGSFQAGSKYTADGLHPNPEGHARMAAYILDTEREKS